MRRRHGRQPGDIEKRLIWILGSSRSGSTWLWGLLGRDSRAVKINEPAIGVHLGLPLFAHQSMRPARVEPHEMRLNDVRAAIPSYFLSDRYRDTWAPLLRELILGRLSAEVTEVADKRRIDAPLVVLKEPEGSQGADILMSLLPRSRLIFLLRDGRDVVDSELDGFSTGGWVAELLPGLGTADEDRLAFINARAHLWLCRVTAVERAYRRHPTELRMMVRYEDLLADTEAVLGRLVDWLSLDLDQAAIEEAAEATLFERKDPSERGRGQFSRAATPGLWRENLSPQEQKLLDEVIGPTLRELGYR